MRRSTLAATIAAALMLVLGVFVGARAVLVQSFERIESDTGKENGARMRNALESELEQLAQITADYGQWDATYDFVSNRDPEWVRINLSRDALETLKVDFVWVVDSQGQTVSAFAPARARFGASLFGSLAELPEGVVHQLTAALPVISASQRVSPLARVLRIDNSLVAYAAVRITRSDLSGPEAGMLVFGRYLNDAVTSRLEQTSQLPVRLTPADEAGHIAGLPVEVDAWVRDAVISGNRTRTTFVRLADPLQIQSYTLLLDAAGQPLAMLSTASPRDALALGKRAIMGVIGALSLGFAALVAILLTVWTRNRNRLRRTAEQRVLDRRRLKHATRHDALTGLPNRHFLHQRLPQLIEEARRGSTKLGVFNIDLDRFKDVNGSLGISNGDRLLTLLAAGLKDSMAEDDLVARVSADEFVVVARNVADADAAEALVAKLRAVIAAPRDIGGVELRPSASIGISLYPTDGTTMDELLERASAARVQATERGRGQHQFFAAELHAHRGESLQLEQALRSAITSNQLFIEYQPTFDLQTERPVSFEALLRWTHPELGSVPPARFIPLLEQGGLINDFGEWVLRGVCRQLADWQRERVPLLPISINVSARQFESGTFAHTVVRISREFGIDASLLHFEITESAVMHQTEDQRGTLQALRRLGSRILIDDFGTGYSSLSYLKHLPIDTLKIDRAFVRDMATDNNDLAIVSAIIGIANSLALNLVAEGIETSAQLDCLRKLGCQCGQGFYFRPSLSAAECRLLLLKLASQRRSADTLQLRVLKSSNDRP